MKRQKISPNIAPLIPYTFLFPALLLLLVFTVIPILTSIALSFFRYNGVTSPQFAGLENFHKIFQDPVAGIALKNSLYYLLVVPVLQFLSLLLALLVNQETKEIRFFRVLFYIPVVTSIVVVAIAWRWLLAENGLLNGILLSLHLVRGPIHWLTDPSTALLSVMMVTLWKGLGYYMIIYLAGLQAIDPQYEEAAKLDGASPVSIFFHVTLPLLKPVVAFCTLISCIAAIKVFAEIYVMTSGGPLDSTNTMVYYMFDLFVNRLQMGYAASLGVLLAVILGIFSYANYRFFSKGGFESW